MQKPFSVPVWKKMWSYFEEIILESVTSEYSEELTVSLDRGRLQLSTKDAIYSFEDKYDNFFTVFKQIELPQKADVLLLGFGLGSIPFMLENNYHKNYHYTGVEIDEAVLYLANKYVLPSLKSEMHLVRADALYYVNQDSNLYDIIAMDVFVNARIPDVFQTMDFLEDARALLTGNGTLLYNRLYKTKKEKSDTDAFYEKIFSKVFPTCSFTIVKGNMVLIGVA